MTNPPTNSVDSELEQIVAFLCGEAPYKGYWYGEKAKGKPMFWWRKDLRDALQAINNLYIKREDVESAIGEDEKHDNGQKMVNDPSLCMYCTNSDERWSRNQFRAELRAKLLTPKDTK